MRFTRYGEPSDKEIDALRQPPYCPVCGDEVPEYGDTCENCDMTTIKHLQLIKAKCLQLLSAHEAERTSKEQYLSSFGSTVEIPPSYDEAGWRSTIAAIESILLLLPRDENGWVQSFIRENDHAQELEFLARSILATWPLELLQ